MKLQSLSASLVSIAIAVHITQSGAALANPHVTTSHVIWNDRGGYVVDYAIKLLTLKQSRIFVKFAGKCDSACTIYLALDKDLSCIGPFAKFGFHLPSGSNSRGNKIAANFLWNSYPYWVRKWLRANGGLSNRLKTMPYEYASQYLEPCPG